MKILKISSSIVFILVVLFVGIGLWMPTDWTCSKSIQIVAKPDVVYPLIANLKRWQEWAPWNPENYPEMQSTYSGADEGVGSQWNWTSDNMGSGWLKISEANPATGIHYELFMNMKGTQETLQGEIALHEEGEKTTVTWIDRGHSGSSILKKWKAVIVGFMVGKQMTSGLNKLKQQLDRV